MRETVRKAIALRRMLSVLIFQFSLFTFHFSIVGCTKADISYIEKVVVRGSVQIYPDMSEYTLPEVQYYFYNTGDETEYFCLDSDENGNFEGALPVGTYRVIATNTSAANVVFSGMEHYETAVAHVDMDNNRSRSDLVFLQQPGDLFSVVVGNLIVTENETIRHDPQPVLLTKTLRLDFNLQEELIDEVAGLDGVLRGVYPSMHLYNQRYEGTTEGSISSVLTFNAEPISNGFGTSVSLFGIVDPQNGEVYTNVLTLDLTMTDGETTTLEVDLTATLSGIIQENQGEIPVTVPLSVEISRTPISLVAQVISWNDSGETEEIIKQKKK